MPVGDPDPEPRNPVPRRVRTALRIARQGDWSQLWRTTARQALPWWLFYTNDLRIVRLRRVREVQVDLGRFRVRPATHADLGRLAVLHDRGDEARAKLDQGDWCFLAEVDERPAAVAWFAHDREHRSRADGIRFHYGAQGCWSYWIEVHPDFRLRGALLKLWIDTFALLRARGVTAVYSGIEETNPPSVRAHLRLGFEEIHRVQMLRLVGLTLHRARTPQGSWRVAAGTWRGEDPEG